MRRRSSWLLVLLLTASCGSYNPPTCNDGQLPEGEPTCIFIEDQNGYIRVDCQSEYVLCGEERLNGS